MMEHHDASGRALWWHCLTENEFGCSNYKIACHVALHKNVLNVDFSGVEKGGICLRAMGPARSDINLGQLANGVYALTISAGEYKETGTLTVDKDHYKITIKERGIKFDAVMLNRLPADAVLGRVAYKKNSEDSLLLGVLIDSLKNAGGAVQKLLPGNYGHFVVNEQGRLVSSPDKKKYESMDRSYGYFVLLFPGDQGNLKKAIDIFMKDHSRKISVDIGDAFYAY